MDILALLQPIIDCVDKTTLHQLSRIIAAMLAMTGRVTMLGISRWTGDECVVSKAGKKMYGLDYFFTGLQQKVIPSLSFFVLSLVSVEQPRSYPISVEQTIRSAEEKAADQAKKAVKKVQLPNRNAKEADLNVVCISFPS